MTKQSGAMIEKQFQHSCQLLQMSINVVTVTLVLRCNGDQYKITGLK